MLNETLGFGFPDRYCVKLIIWFCVKFISLLKSGIALLLFITWIGFPFATDAKINHIKYISCIHKFNIHLHKKILQTAHIYYIKVLFSVIFFFESEFTLSNKYVDVEIMLKYIFVIILQVHKKVWLFKKIIEIIE